jgi:hypothetical protein
MGEWGSVHNFFACRACRAGGAVPGCLEIRQHALKKAGPLAVGVHRWDGWKSGRAEVSLLRSFSPYLYISLSLSLALSTFSSLAPSQTSGRRTVGPTAVSTNRTRARRRSSAPHSHFFPAATDLLFSDANFRRFGPEKTATVVADVVTNDETTERRQKRSVLIFFVKKYDFAEK